MSSSNDERSPELDMLLREEASRGGPPEDVKAAVRSALVGAFAAADASPSGPPSSLPKSAGKLVRALTALGLLSTGAVVGGAVHAKLAVPKIVVQERIVTVVSSAPALPVPTPPVVVTASSRPATPTSAPTVAPVAKPRYLAEERRVLDIAAAALARGDAADALRALDRHAREFPTGQLEEEREAMAVQALVLANRKGDATARAARFRSRFPDSPFLATIDEALR